MYYEVSLADICEALAPLNPITFPQLFQPLFL